MTTKRTGVPVHGLSRAGALAGCLLVMAACAGRPAPEGGTPPDRVRAVVMPYLTFMPFHIAREEGLFAEQNLDVEFIRLERIQELMTGLALGEVDVAAGMLTINVVNQIASGARVRLVGALGHLDPAGCSFSALVARREALESSALEDSARLAGLRWDADVLLPYGYWLDEALRPYGMTFDDVDVVNLPEAAAVEALRNGSIDVTLISEPFLSLLLASPEAEVWRRTNDLMPDYQISVLMYGPTLLDERPGVGERFATAMLQAIRLFGQGKTARNLDIVERATGLTRAEVERACWAAVRADARVRPGSFDGFQEWALSRGYIDGMLSGDELIDHRFVDVANRVLAR